MEDGGGVDVFQASKLVGQNGKVIGLDATPEMIFRARETIFVGSDPSGPTTFRVWNPRSRKCTIEACYECGSRVRDCTGAIQRQVAQNKNSNPVVSSTVISSIGAATTAVYV